MALALLASLPFLLVTYPPLTDYPSHLARYYVMLDGGQNPWLARHYTFQWLLVGNLGADLLMVPLGTLLGVERAGWLIGAVIPALTGLGIVAVEWTVRRRVGAGSVLALVFVWSPMMLMGFYNFTLALALALLAFALWVRLEGKAWRPVLFVPIGFVVWLCHASGWGVLGVMVFGYEWSRDKSWRAFVAPWPLIFPIVPMLMADGARGSLNFGDHVVRYKFSVFFKSLRDTNVWLDLGSLALVFVFLRVGLRRRAFDGRLGWAALGLFALAIVMPRHFGGGDYADYRLFPVALMLACLSVDWKAGRGVMVALSALFLVRLAATSVTWHQQSEEIAEALDVMDAIPRGATVAGAVAIDFGHWPLNPMEHVQGYATVRRDALVNTHFAVRGIHMLGLRDPAMQRFVDPSQRALYHVGGPGPDLSGFEPAAQAQYLWYVGPPPTSLPNGARVVARSDNAILARLANPARAR